jgi:DNA polymerase-3 subunit gamma/tau
MSYLVLARKYRPQTFNEVCAQEHITRALTNALEMNRVAHAYLFTGPRGVGKTSLARIYAKSLNCVHGPTPNPCNVCANCVDITEGKSMDVIEIDAASNTGVGDVRELQREMIYKPVNSRFKVYIIDEVHMLSKSAFNALLKTLEEPPDDIIFIFATTEPQKVLPTIVSRCQRYDFRRMPIEAIIGQLRSIIAKENLTAEDDALFFIAKKADGGMRDALSLLDQTISYGQHGITAKQVFDLFGILPYEAFIDVMKAVMKRQSAKTLDILHRILEEGNDLQEFLNGLLDFLRGMLLLKHQLDVPEIPQAFLPTVKELSEAFSEPEILYLLSYIIKVKADVKISGNPVLLAEMAFIKMAGMGKMVPVDQLLESVRNMPAMTVSSTVSDVAESQKQVLDFQVNHVKEEMVREAQEEKPKISELSDAALQQHWPSLMKRIEMEGSKVIPTYFIETTHEVRDGRIQVTLTSNTAYVRLEKLRGDVERISTAYFGIPCKWDFVLKEKPKEEVRTDIKLDDIRRELPDLADFIEKTNSDFKPLFR